jgi:hypothetical protein
MGVEITQEHISTAHRLPSTRKVKERFIVKFVHRDTKDEFYKKRSKLAGKKSKDLPSVANEFGKSIHRAENIFISESLTPYRTKLFGRTNEFKKNNQSGNISGQSMIKYYCVNLNIRKSLGSQQKRNLKSLL